MEPSGIEPLTTPANSGIASDSGDALTVSPDRTIWLTRALCGNQIRLPSHQASVNQRNSNRSLSCPGLTERNRVAVVSMSGLPVIE